MPLAPRIVRLSPWHPRVSRLTRFRRAAYPFVMMPLLIIGAIFAVMMIAGPALAQFIGGAVTASSYDIAPLVQTGIAGVFLIVTIIGAWFIYGHVADANARAALLSGLEKAVSFGFNVTAGALKDKTLNVNVGSSVVANALKYAQANLPAALARFGFDDKAAARALWARLPHVDGDVTDTTFNQIVAAANGTPPAGGVAGSADDIAQALLAAINRAKSGGTAAPVPQAGEPAAAAPIAVSSASPAAAPI